MNKILIAVMATFTFSTAHATTVQSIFGADDSANGYISTNDTVEGTLFGSVAGGISITNTALTDGVVNYLHFQIFNTGGPVGFVGEFNLSDTNFKFANGTQTYLTDATTFNFSTTGYGIDYITPDTFGPIAAFGGSEYYTDAQNTYFIGLNNGGFTPYYGSVAIYSNSVAPVPEPETYAMMIAGIGLIGFVAKRKKKLS